MAKKINEEKIITKYFLFKLNMDGQLLQEFRLDDIDYYNDILIFQNKLFVCSKRQIHFIECVKI